MCGVGLPERDMDEGWRDVSRGHGEVWENRSRRGSEGPNVQQARCGPGPARSEGLTWRVNRLGRRGVGGTTGDGQLGPQSP